MAHQPQRGVVGLGSGGTVEDLAEPGRRDLRQLLRQKDGRRGRTAEEGVVVGQFLHLRVGNVGKFVAAIADIDAPQACHPVEDLVALGVVDERAIGAGDDP